MDNIESIDIYIGLFPENIEKKLIEIRKIIREAAPDAIEKISYKIPTFYLFGNLVHFSANKEHIGFYPGESGMKHFKNRLSMYKMGKGSVQFPYNEVIPFDLIREIVQFRVKENIMKSEIKKKK